MAIDFGSGSGVRPNDVNLLVESMNGNRFLSGTTNLQVTFSGADTSGVIRVRAGSAYVAGKLVQAADAYFAVTNPTTGSRTDIFVITSGGTITYRLGSEITWVTSGDVPPVNTYELAMATLTTRSGTTVLSPTDRRIQWVSGNGVGI